VGFLRFLASEVRPMSENCQTLCDAAQQPDALDSIREVVQQASATPTLLSRFTGKLQAMLETIGIIRALDPAKIDALGGRDEVKALIGKIYDDYIAPIDLPWVPALIESTMVDPFLRSMLLRIVDEVYDRMGS
jgi:hypothetical protein